MAALKGGPNCGQQAVVQRCSRRPRPEDRDVVLRAAEHKATEVINAGSCGVACDEFGHIDRAKPLHNGRKIWTAQIKATPSPGLFGDGGLAFGFLDRPLK